MSEVEVGRRIESHEADMWARMVEATAAQPGDPLKARVDRSGPVPLFALAALDVPLFNRVIGLGVSEPADDATLDRVLGWYRTLGQTRFWVEVTPVSPPADLSHRLTVRGLADSGRRMAKTWCEPHEIAVAEDVTVEELGSEDGDAFAACNTAAWNVPDVLLPWFRATVGADGFRHFGVRADGRLVSTGTLFVTDGVAWLGFGATHPGYRGRGYQTALLAHRLNEAWRMGCALAHSETAEDTADEPNPSLHNMHRIGMRTLYDKELWAPSAG